MRAAPFRCVFLLALLLAPLNARAESIMQSGMPGTQGFAYFPFWQKALIDMSAARAPAATAIAALPGVIPIASQCPMARTCIPQAWTSFLDSVRGRSRYDKMELVNRWANMRPYVEDIANWGVPDYWETPGEFLARGGDCEDFAIAKYFSLRKLGFPADDIRIVIVNDTNLNAFHAVLVVRNGGVEWLLDNQIQQIVPMNVAVQYVPIYSLNENGWWLHSLPRISLDNLTVAAGPVSTRGW